jgi:hypothetical protein
MRPRTAGGTCRRQEAKLHMVFANPSVRVRPQIATEAAVADTTLLAGSRQEYERRYFFCCRQDILQEWYCQDNEWLERCFLRDIWSSV